MIRSRPVRLRPRRPAVATTGLAVAAAMASLAPLGAHAQELDCAVTGDRRHVRLELPGRDHLCEVSVTYLASGERRVMWYADNDTAFCSERLEDLVGKYESDWGFDCDRWPDASGLERLGTAARARLDDELRAALDGLERDDPGARITGVRAVTRDSVAADAPGDAAHAVQFIVREGDGTLRTELRLLGDFATRLVTDDLGAGLASGTERIESAWVESWRADGALVVATSVSPPAPTEPVAGSVPESAESCRGSLILRPDAEGRLVASTPHRYACGA